MPSIYVLLITLCGLGLAYRYYAAFLAARVALDASRRTPAHDRRDGKDYHPTNKWVLFGHHFAAIAGAGPLVGPGVLATSFLVTYAWFYLLRGGTVTTIWPMFGIANQLLGMVALAIGTTYILRHAPQRVYALTTFLPFLFMAVTVLTSGV